MKGSAQDSITVFLLDEHPLVRQGLAVMLEQGGFKVCGRFRGGRDPLRARSGLSAGELRRPARGQLRRTHVEQRGCAYLLCQGDRKAAITSLMSRLSVRVRNVDARAANNEISMSGMAQDDTSAKLQAQRLEYDPEISYRDYADGHNSVKNNVLAGSQTPYGKKLSRAVNDCKNSRLPGMSEVSTARIDRQSVLPDAADFQYKSTGRSEGFLAAMAVVALWACPLNALLAWVPLYFQEVTRFPFL